MDALGLIAAGGPLLAHSVAEAGAMEPLSEMLWTSAYIKVVWSPLSHHKPHHRSTLLFAPREAQGIVVPDDVYMAQSAQSLALLSGCGQAAAQRSWDSRHVVFVLSLARALKMRQREDGQIEDRLCWEAAPERWGSDALERG